MKKYLLLIPVFLILLSGCGKKANQTICTRTGSGLGYSMDVKYTISYEDKYINGLKFEEVYSADDEETLNAIEQLVRESYETAASALSGYDIDIKREGSKVYANVDIDYTKVEMDKLKEISEGIEELLEDDKLSYEKIMEYYKNAGFTCK